MGQQRGKKATHVRLELGQVAGLPHLALEVDQFVGQEDRFVQLFRCQVLVVPGLGWVGVWVTTPPSKNKTAPRAFPLSRTHPSLALDVVSDVGRLFEDGKLAGELAGVLRGRRGRRRVGGRGSDEGGDNRGGGEDLAHLKCTRMVWEGGVRRGIF